MNVHINKTLLNTGMKENARGMYTLKTLIEKMK